MLDWDSFHPWVYGDMIKGKILRFSGPGIAGGVNQFYSDFFSLQA